MKMMASKYEEEMMLLKLADRHLSKNIHFLNNITLPDYKVEETRTGGVKRRKVGASGHRERLLMQINDFNKTKEVLFPKIAKELRRRHAHMIEHLHVYDVVILMTMMMMMITAFLLLLLSYL
jgi:hypothetical protein